jgi:hypothetical protein
MTDSVVYRNNPSNSDFPLIQGSKTFLPTVEASIRDWVIGLMPVIGTSLYFEKAKDMLDFTTGYLKSEDTMSAFTKARDVGLSGATLPVSNDEIYQLGDKNYEYSRPSTYDASKVESIMNSSVPNRTDSKSVYDWVVNYYASVVT